MNHLLENRIHMEKLFYLEPETRCAAWYCNTWYCCHVVSYLFRGNKGKDKESFTQLRWEERCLWRCKLEEENVSLVGRSLESSKARGGRRETAAKDEAVTIWWSICYIVKKTRICPKCTTALPKLSWHNWVYFPNQV